MLEITWKMAALSFIVLISQQPVTFWETTAATAQLNRLMQSS